MNTETKSIEGFVGRYSVTSDGEVISMNFAGSGMPGILKPLLAGRGYHYVVLYKGNKKGRTFAVHHLVCNAFIGSRNGLTVNHKNGIKTDNRAENLEYATYGENALHAYKTGLRSPTVGEISGHSKLTNNNVLEIRNLYRSGIKQGDLSKMFNVTSSAISRVVSGKRWGHLTMAAGGESHSVVV